MKRREFLKLSGTGIALVVTPSILRESEWSGNGTETLVVNDVDFSDHGVWAEAAYDENGRLVITVTNAGSGYTSVPTVTFDAPTLARIITNE